MEHGSEKEINEVMDLVESYASLGDYGRKDMRRKYPHIDFDDLLAKEDTAKAVEYTPTMDTVNISGSSQNESGWATGLRMVAWLNLFSGVISSFVAAWQVGAMFADWGQDMNWGLFFATLIAVLLATFLTTAVIMVFADIARDISITKCNTTNTQKDIADIKNMLEKNKA